MKLGIFIVLALSCLVFNAQALTFFKLEEFLEFAEVVLDVPTPIPTKYDWWTPYYGTPQQPIPLWGKPTSFSYIISSGSLGGQVDLVIGYEDTSNPGTSASLVIAPNDANGGCFYTLGFVGGGYWQWDGVDDVGANARPAKASVSPGLGSNPAYTYLPAHRAGGQTIDLTLGGAVKALTWQALTDLNCTYTWDFFDQQNRSSKYSVNITESDGFSGYQILFSTSSGDIDAGWSGFTSIAAIQLAVYTFQSDTNAIDTQFKFLNFVGYQITGTVVVDCDCTPANGIDRAASGQPLTMRTGTGATPSGTVLATVNTDATGAFVFTGTPLNSGSYQICLETPNTGLSLCVTTPVCFPVTLANFVDPPALSYVLVQTATLTPPGNADIECDDCTDPTTLCTGFALLTDCNTGSVPVIDFDDTPVVNGCVVTINRVFRSGSLRATQVIRISDTLSPVLIRPATNQSPSCDNLTPTFSQWITTRAGATWDDCTSFTVSTTPVNPVAPTGCGTTAVTFTANDPCLNPGTPTTASYTIVDNFPPTIDPDAADSSASCNLNGSDFTAFNAWLSNNGGAVASDNCGVPTWTNNYSLLPQLQRGCNNRVTVTFTATDGCGRSDTTTASFLINDQVGPTASGATSPNDVCDANLNTRFNAWLNAHGNAVATDACTASSALTWDDDFPGTTFPVSGCRSVVTVTFRVFDQCLANSATTGTYTVNDNVGPRITRGPDDLVVACDSANPNAQISAWRTAHGNAVAVDDCSGTVNWSDNFANLNTNCGSNTVTFTACDACDPGNCNSATALFTISDSIAPQYTTFPTSAQAECDSGTQAAFNTWITSGANAVLTDNCDTAGIRFTNDNGPGFPFGCNAVRTVTFSAVDACQNPAPLRTASFRVVDTRDPIIVDTASSPVVECDNTINSQYTTWRLNHGGATATDVCASVVTWSDNGPAAVTAPGAGTCTSTFVVTFNANDGCGNSAPTTGTFTIRDTTRPVISPGASSITGECTGSSNQQSITNWLTDNGGARATDACSSVQWANNFDGLSGGCTSAATVVFTATDSCGLSSSTSAVYSISDTSAPVINPPAQPFTSQCGPNTNQDFVNWVNNHGGAVADDACQALASLTWSDDVGDVTFTTCGRRTVTFTVTDPCDRSASTTAVFTVADQTAPTFSPPARDLQVECQKTGNQQDYNTWLATRAGSVATDACALQIVYANNGPSVGPSRCASVTVTFTATDNCNNIGRTTATFSVVDTTAPVFTHFPLTRLADCSDPATNQASLNSWLSNFAGANAVDSCTPSSELVYTAQEVSGDGDFCITRQQYRFTVTDTCGRSVSDTAQFIVTDIEDPYFIIEPTNATFVCDGAGNVNEISDWINSNGGGGLADDACQGSVVWSNNYLGVGPFTCTSNLVTYVVSDGCGNAIAKTVLLTITDDQPPEFSDVPDDITVRCDIDTHPEFLGYPSAFDVCTGNPIITFEDEESDDPPIGNCPGNHYILRTFSAFDECGNIAFADQLITVNLTRSAGPCDPSGCVCDDCCPEAAPSNCLPSTCQATPCRATPCTASTCLCPVVAKASTAVKAADELPQCEPIYIYVHDDDDSTSASGNALQEPKMLVTNRLVDFKNKSDASVISFSVLLFFVMFFLF